MITQIIEGVWFKIKTREGVVYIPKTKIVGGADFPTTAQLERYVDGKTVLSAKEIKGHGVRLNIPTGPEEWTVFDTEEQAKEFADTL